MKNLILLTLLLAAAAQAQVPPRINYQGRVAVRGTNFHGTGQFKFALVDAGTNQNVTATALSMAGSSVTFIFVQNGGSGYTSAPVVTVAPPAGGGVTATATASISGGAVTSITINNGGSGYAEQPVVTIAPPPENLEHQVYWSNAGDLAPNEVPSTSVSLPVDKGLYSVRLGDTSVTNMGAFNPDIFYTPLFLRVWFSDGVNGFQQLTPDQPLASAPYALQARLAESVPPNSIGGAQLANGAVGSAKLASGAAAANINGQNVVLGQGTFTNIVLTKLNVGTTTLSASLFGNLEVPGLYASNAIRSGFEIQSDLDVVAGRDVIAGGDLRGRHIYASGDVDAQGGLYAGASVLALFDVKASRDIGAGRDITYVGTITDISDVRLKDLGEPFTAGLDTIARIEPLHYRFKPGNALGAPSDAIHVGVSAQALQAALPEAVVQRSDGYLGVSQEPVVWALVNAVKELQAENEALKARVESLEAGRP